MINTINTTKYLLQHDTEIPQNRASRFSHYSTKMTSHFISSITQKNNLTFWCLLKALRTLSNTGRAGPIVQAQHSLVSRASPNKACLRVGGLAVDFLNVPHFRLATKLFDQHEIAKPTEGASPQRLRFLQQEPLFPIARYSSSDYAHPVVMVPAFIPNKTNQQQNGTLTTMKNRPSLS